MREELQTALGEALKSGDKRRVSTLRLISAAIKDRDIGARTTEDGRVDDNAILEILSRMVKQREESARLYEEGGRIELADQEREEITIIREFLPAQLDETAMHSACESAIEAVNAEGLRDMGKCMAHLKQNYPGKMDFSRASSVIKTMLQ